MMTKKIIHPTLLLFVLLLTTNAFAGKRYWRGNNSNKNWNSTGNWSTTSGGTTGASVPGSNDSVYYDANGTGQCGINANVNIKMLTIASGYTDTIKQNNNAFSVTGKFTMSGGVFLGSSNTGANITTGAFTVSGGIFKSTVARLSVSTLFEKSAGSFLHNNGELFLVDATLKGADTLYNCTFHQGGTATFSIDASAVITVEHLLTIAACTMNGTGTINVHGDIAQTGTAQVSAGTATITINGTGNQNFNGQTDVTYASRGWMPSITINKTSGTLSLNNYVTVGGNWNHSNGTINWGTSTLVFLGGNKTITETDTLHKVWFQGLSGVTCTITLSDTLIVGNKISFLNTSGYITMNGGIKALGDLDMSGAVYGMVGNASITFCGEGSQTLTGRSTLSTGYVRNIIIDKPNGTLYLSSLISVDGSYWHYKRGTINSTGSTVAFIYTTTVTGSHILNNVTFHNYTTTISSGTTLTVEGTLTVSGTGAAKINTGIVNAQGNIVVNNSSTTGGGTGLIKINGSGNQTLTGSGVAGSGKLCDVTIDKTSGTLTLASTITTAGTWTHTQGTLVAGTSVVIAPTVNSAGGTLANFTVYSGTTLLSSNLTVSGKVTISSGATLNGNSKSIFVGGDWDNTGTFTYSNTDVNFTGSGTQYITKPSSTVNFHQLKVNKSGGKLVLSAPVTVNNALTLTKGKVVTTATNILALVDNATTTAGSDSAYVSGPMKKTGNDAFTFPLGDTLLSTGAYHPLTITAPSSTSDAFTAQYIAKSVIVDFPSLLNIQADSLERASSCEYWTLARNVGSSNIQATLGWNTNACLLGLDSLIGRGWNGTLWKDLTKTNPQLTGMEGSVTLSLTNAWNGTTAVPLTVGTKIPTTFTDYIISPYCIDEDSTGSIAVVINGGSTPHTYSWSTGASSENLSNLSAGTYTLTVTDHYNRTFVRTYALEKCIQWDSIPSTLTSSNTGTLQKVSGGDNWANAKVQSHYVVNSVPKNDWCSFIVGDTTSKALFGFSVSGNDVVAHESNLMVYLEGKALTAIETDNDGFYSKQSLGNVALGDCIKIQLNNTQAALYYKNGVLIHTGKLITHANLRYTANLFGNSNTIKNARCSSNEMPEVGEEGPVD